MIQATKIMRSPPANLAKSPPPINTALEAIASRSFTTNQSLMARQPSHLMHIIFPAVKKFPFAKNRSSLFKTKAPAKNNPALTNPSIKMDVGMACSEEYLEKGGDKMLGEMSAHPTMPSKQIEIIAKTETTDRPIKALTIQMTFLIRLKRGLAFGEISFVFINLKSWFVKRSIPAPPEFSGLRP